MKLVYPKLLKENKTIILENMKMAKGYVSQGKLSEDDLKKLIEIDPTPQKKYVGWLSKIWINENPDFDDLRNTIEEFDVFANKGKTKIKDIYQVKKFDDLKQEVDRINKSGENISVKDLESDYDIVIDNSDLIIASPHTHEASRYLGLSKFAFRDCGDGGKDSSWCTTYKVPDHFNSYYYKNNVTFYYIKIKSKELAEKIKEAFPTKYKQYMVVALAVLDNGQIDGYDGLDKQMSPSDIAEYTKIIGID
jgi:hypothetical protein